MKIMQLEIVSQNSELHLGFERSRVRLFFLTWEVCLFILLEEREREREREREDQYS